MSRLLLVVLALVAGAAFVATAGASPTLTFTTVPSAPLLLSSEVPNGPGTVALPSDLSMPTAARQQLPFGALQALWQRAGAAYGIPWQVLASINKIESNFGRNMGPSSAGAVGWMQFMPSTWLRWGMDASGDGVADPWNAEDAVFSAARYLAAAGGRTDVPRAIFAYNHAQWYVDEVLQVARLYGQMNGAVAFTLDRMQLRLEEAQELVAQTNRKLVAATQEEQRLAALTHAMTARENDAELLSHQLKLQKRTAQLDARRAAAAVRVERLETELARAERTLALARSVSSGAGFLPAAGVLLAAPAFSGGYAFPVGGGPSSVSVGRFHHDYPAADIAAPAGSPVYALANGLVVEAWDQGGSACGIGFTMQTGDGIEWTYCHLSYLDPGVQPGVVVPVGAPVGLVGSTGHSTGPHLHLQLQPAGSYPQDEPWFQAFAGTAFSWQGELASESGALFQIVEAPDETSESAVIPFFRTEA